MAHEDAALLADCADAVLARHEPASWRHLLDDTWHHVVPIGHRARKQGWKLHVPATPLSACIVLSRCVAVFAAHRCAFKFARSLRELQMLVEPNARRESAGKFVTAYPDDDAHAVRIAEALHEATVGLPGQEILTDRRFRASSQVYYRYGGFSPDQLLNLDGEYVSVLHDDAGNAETERRTVGRPAPGWAVDPFQQTDIGPAPVPESVLVGELYRVHTALRQTNRGGVYLATDTGDGTEVVLKRFRRHTGAAVDNTDSFNRARAEARLLGVLGPLGVSPKFLGLFNHRGDMFVAQERIDGVPLRRYVARHRRPTPDGALALDTALVLDFAGQIVELLAVVHDAGYVLSDLTPNNIMVTGDDRLTLIDLESGMRSWEVGVALSTRGHTAPELDARERLVAPAPDVAVDLYCLGATLFYLASGAHPQSAPDSPVRAMVTLMGQRNPAMAALHHVINALLADDPRARPSLDKVRSVLHQPQPAMPAAVPDPDELIDDMLARLRQTMTPDAPWLWPPGAAGARYDPCSVHTGAAGVLIALHQAAMAGRGESIVDETAQWLVSGCRTSEPPCPA